MLLLPWFSAALWEAAAEWQLHAKVAGMVKKRGALDEKKPPSRIRGEKKKNVELFDERAIDTANFDKNI